MSINEELSFTEYTLTEDTTDFIISFDRIGGSTDEVSILVNNTPIEELVGYTVLQVNFSTWQVNPALPAGTVVRLARTTNLDKMVYVFTAGSKFIAKNVDSNFKQIQHSQQEIRDRQDKLERDATALLLEVQDVKVIAEQAALDANEALDKVDEILNTGVVPAGMILTNTGQNQQAVNDFGGAKWWPKPDGYDFGASVYLDTGVRVRSTISGNLINPNVSMAGWTLKTDAEISTWSGRTQEQENKDFITSVYDYSELVLLEADAGRVAYVKKEGLSGEFVFDSTSALAVDGGTVIQGIGGKWLRVDLSEPKVRWWGAVGNNVVNDSAAYLAAISFYVATGILIDGEGLTYKTTSRGTNIMAVKNAKINASPYTITFDQTGNSFQEGGSEWRGGMTEYGTFRAGGGFPLTDGYNKGVISIGMGSLRNVTNINNTIAIGPNTLSECTNANAPRHNIAIGDSALTHAYSDGSTYGGGRNTAVGSLAGHFITTGNRNSLFGRDAGQSITTGEQNTGIGYMSLMGGTAPVGWTGSIEMLWGEGTGNYGCALGSQSLALSAGNHNIGIGYTAATALKRGSTNTIIGSTAGSALESKVDWNGNKALFGLSINGTYTISGSTVTVVLSSAPALALQVGGTVDLNVTTGDLTVESGKAVITALTNTTTFSFTLPTPKSGSTVGGNLILRKVISTTAESNYLCASNVLIGFGAAQNKTKVLETISIGVDSLAVVNDTQTSQSIVIGTRAARDCASLDRSTIMGHQAGRYLQSGLDATGSYSNITAIGNDSRISGDNQVQLGNSATTTYVYGTVQNRSDARDKADIRDTVLGLDFINSLRPVDYKWDMREDYMVIDPETGDITILEKDGSKKRSRYHHGFIAQELQQLDQDFGGLQDHSINGGEDVLSVGYDEMIAPLVKAVQELTARVKELESK